MANEKTHILCIVLRISDCQNSVLNETYTSLNIGLEEYYGTRVGKIEVTGGWKGSLRV